MGQALGPQETWDLMRVTRYGGRPAGEIDPGVMHRHAPSSLPAAGPDGMTHPRMGCGASVGMLNRLVNRNVHSGDVFVGVVGGVDNTLRFSLAPQMKYNPDSVRPFIPAPWLV
jgi:hypothetical protein